MVLILPSSLLQLLLPLEQQLLVLRYEIRLVLRHRNVHARGACPIGSKLSGRGDQSETTIAERQQ